MLSVNTNETYGRTNYELHYNTIIYIIFIFITIKNLLNFNDQVLFLPNTVYSGHWRRMANPETKVLGNQAQSFGSSSI